MSIPDGTLLASTPVEYPASTVSILQRSLGPEELRRFSASSLYAIQYASDNLRINGYMALPPAEESAMPVLLFNRGGSARGALTPESAAQQLGLYAAWGYVALASQYRGAGGSEGVEEWGGRDVDDVMNLLKLALSFDYVDTERVGIIGGSRGGMMTFQMLRRSDVFRAAVSFGAPTRFDHLPKTAYIRKLMMRYLKDDDDFAAEAAHRSAEFWTDELCKTTPLLVLHGTGDKRVSPRHAYRLGMALQDAKHPYKLIMYDNADHILAGRRRESNRDIRAWVDHYVRDKSALPRVGPHGA